MNHRASTVLQRLVRRSLGLFLAAVLSCLALAQTDQERRFPQSKAAVEKVLETMQPGLAGRLPVLDGFAKSGDHPLDRYERGYYKATVQVTPLPSGGSLVHISVKVTAWYSDPTPSHSGYQLLISNGRLEADLLDQLAEQLAASSSETVPVTAAGVPPTAPAAKSTAPASAPAEPHPSAQTPPEATISAPGLKFPDSPGTFSSSVTEGLASTVHAQKADHDSAAEGNQKNAELQKEADNLTEILKNQGHPKNLIAVNKAGTAVVANPSLSAKPLFLASLHDEFELLDFNADWVHVRISGLSRGWIWRNNVEMPEGIADNAESRASAVGDLYHVVREESAPFPGDWEPLRGKTVKILSVQKADANKADAGPGERLAFAKFLLDKSYSENSQKSADLAGIVVIFDSADGGMIGATMAALQQWQAGTLSDAALWHKCFFDPPEILDSATRSAQ